MHVWILRKRRSASRARHGGSRPGLGTSLGAAVAIQEAAQDAAWRPLWPPKRFQISRTVATERAPRFFTSGIVERAFTRAERDGHFLVDAVSPVAAAAQIRVPVLLIHGTDDVDTAPEHARRVFAALTGPKRLLLVPRARHNESLRAEAWKEIEMWIDAVLVRRGAHRPSARCELPRQHRREKKDCRKTVPKRLAQAGVRESL